MTSLENDYNFKRIARPGETTWQHVFDRFKGELAKRGSTIPREDLDFLLDNVYALPNSPALLTAGDPKGFYASACSSYPVHDTMRGGPFAILDVESLSNDATVAGIGVGFNFSQLREAKSSVRGREGITGGPVSFLRKFSGSLGEITQATRKSACMGLLDVHHPDIMKFIDAKIEDGKISNFNLSIMATDEFMQAVENKTTYEVRPIKGEPFQRDACEVFDAACRRSHADGSGGEPCWVWPDAIIRDYFDPKRLNIWSILLNPCSEAILSYDFKRSDGTGEDWLELCVLASVNLPRWIKLDTADRARVVRTTVRLLNDLIDLQDYVSPLHKRGMKEINRKIGVGVAGVATVLAMKGLKYSSQEGRDYVKSLWGEIADVALAQSQEMGNVNGLGRYNSSLFSIAPTSTLSNIFEYYNIEGCSYGSEPYFALEHDVHNSFGDFKKHSKIADVLTDVSHIETANELDWKGHVLMVETMLKTPSPGTMMSVSKTVNFNSNMTLEQYKECVMFCWKCDIKGVTIYRDGSRANQVISTSSSYSENRPTDIVYKSAPKRPASLPCEIHHTAFKKQDWVVMIGLLNGKPYEVFAGEASAVCIAKKHKTGRIEMVGKKGSKKYNLHLGEGDDETIVRDVPAAFQNLQHGTLTKMVSYQMRHGAPISHFCELLNKCEEMGSFLRVIARVLKKYIPDATTSGEACSCGGKLQYVQGCLTCVACGSSKCG